MTPLSLPCGDLSSPVEQGYEHLLAAAAAPAASGTTPRGEVVAAHPHWGTHCAGGPAEELASPPGDGETLGMTRNWGVGGRGGGSAALFAYRYHQEAARS